MKVLRMINTVNADNNVEAVDIRLSSNNKWNDEILKMMISRYSNVYCIGVYDWNNSVDDRMHNIIKQWAL